VGYTGKTRYMTLEFPGSLQFLERKKKGRKIERKKAIMRERT